MARRYHRPRIDAQGVAHERQLVGECDVHVPERILRQLYHLRRARISQVALAVDERLVQTPGGLGAGRRDSADHAVVADQLTERVARQHPLRAVGYADIAGVAESMGERQVGPQLRQTGAHRLGGADRRGGLDDDQVPCPKSRREALDRAIEGAEIGAVVGPDGSRHRDDERVGGLRLAPGPEPARGNRFCDRPAQARLADRRLARVDGLDSLRIDIDAEHVGSAGRKQRGGWQAHVPQTHHAYTAGPWACRRADNLSHGPGPRVFAGWLGRRRTGDGHAPSPRMRRHRRGGGRSRR